MYECPNCGGNLRFDIKSQQLGCVHCDAKYDPYAVSKEKDAEEDSYELTVFRCPQCYGEVYSTDNTIAGFCSFCGASTILTSRLVKGQKMGYLIPFQKTKEECKKEYAKMMRRAFFVPKELKDPKYIDSFRGIYMPYWIYYIRQGGKEPVQLTGFNSHRRGDYIITDYYRLDVGLEAYYKGISYDASSSFSDAISESLAPFNVKNMKQFAPTFLSGFYADTSDVDSSVYEDDAREFATQETENFLKKNEVMKRYTLQESGSALEAKLNTDTVQIDTALLPVWFMSYRNQGRVAYAAVNGQTGKVVADMPVDIKKYVGASGVLTVILFVLLNLFLTLQPTVLTIVVSILAMLTAILHTREIRLIAIKESYEDDQGAMVALAKKELKRAQARQERMGQTEGSYVAATAESLPQQSLYAMRQEAREIQKKERKKSKDDLMASQLVTLIVVAQLFMGTVSMIPTGTIQLVLIGGALIGTGIATWKCFSHIKKIKAKSGMPRSIFCVLALIITVMIVLVQPASDLFYYGCVILILAAVFAVLVDLIVSYNILATRQLPQFEYKGGDDRA